MTRYRPFWDRVNKTDGCWLWTGYINAGGYGRVTIDGRAHQAHRIAYVLEVGPIPEGMDLDHLCRNRACVRPSHLEPTTNRENVLRGIGRTAENAAKTHCIRGHELTPENTYLHPRPDRRGAAARVCQTCKRALRAQRTAAGHAVPA